MEFSEWGANYGLQIYDVTASTLVYNNDYVGNNASLNLPPGYLAAGHSFRWNMRASDAAGFSGYSGLFYFQTQAAPPSITSVYPNPVTGSDSRQTVTVYGNNFVNAPTLTLTWTVPPLPPAGGYVVPSADVTFVSTTELQMSIDTTTAADNWTVQATNPDGQSSAAFGFVVDAPVAPEPSITSLSPISMLRH